MTDKEAMKLALEALEGVLDDAPKVLEASISGDLYEVVQCREAITALKEALAQPEQHQDWCASLTQMLMSMPPKPAPCNCKPPQRTEQEPVAWVNKERNTVTWDKLYPDMDALYTHPPQRTEPLIGCVNHDCDKCKENT